MLLGTRPDELTSWTRRAANHPVARLVSTICRRCQSRLPTMCEWVPSCPCHCTPVLDAARTFTLTLAPDTIAVFLGRNEMTASPSLSSAPILLGWMDGWMDDLVAFTLGQCDVSGVSRWGDDLHLHLTFSPSPSPWPQLFLPASFLAEALTRERDEVGGWQPWRESASGTCLTIAA